MQLSLRLECFYAYMRFFNLLFFNFRTPFKFIVQPKYLSTYQYPAAKELSEAKK